ncbi:MAG: VCP-like ATPase [Candidatus Heimdallarchaeota archaeon LC_2]|nr:MAG: VCP-like ATPase [Candidatus Heimdallarchaeota archaeon LC_2]
MVQNKLRVEEAKKSDVGKQIARIHVNIAEKLGVKTGDIIEITGKKSTYARVWRSKPPIIQENSIRIESIIRRNAGIKIDDFVSIKMSKVSIGKNITIDLIDGKNDTVEITKLIQMSLNEKILASNQFWNINIGLGKNIQFTVLSTIPKEPIIFNEGTQINSTEKSQTEEDRELDQPKSDIQYHVSYEDIGGLDPVIKKLREMIELPLRYPEIFDRVGIQPPKGVLLYGPPGTGKTILAKAIASETSSYFISISGPEIMSKYYGEAENKLREFFQLANENSPSIIFIDEIDSITPNRDNSNNSTDSRIVAQLLTLMDGIEDRDNIVVIAATNRENSIDPALRRGGRFDREIEIGIPDLQSRRDIFEIHTRGMPLDNDVDLLSLSRQAQGFVGADINIVVKEAALHSIQRIIPEIDFDKVKEVDISILQKIIVKMSDFEKAFTEVSPSSLREVIVEIPNVTWDSIAGLEEIKKELKESLEWPVTHKGLFEKMKIKPEKGILLYGPPGSGKTMLAKAVANEINSNFISIKGPELISKWVGETEKGIREIFRKARIAAPCIIFFDEIDSIASTRALSNNNNELTRRIVSQLLTEIDGVEETKGIMILGATNRPDLLDSALIRPGRFDRMIFVGNPDLDTRKAIFKLELDGSPIEKDIDINDLAKMTDNFSGAEIVQVVHKAKIEVLKSYIYNNNEKKLILTKNNIIEIIKREEFLRKTEYSHHPPRISDINDINIA